MEVCQTPIPINKSPFATEQGLKARTLEARILNLRKEDDASFKDLLRQWKEVNKFAQELERVDPNLHGSPTYLSKIGQRLEAIKEKLGVLNEEITKQSVFIRVMPLSTIQNRFLILKLSSNAQIGAFYVADEKFYVLESQSFPKELRNISQPEQFFGLLENASVVMHNDPKDLSQSSFSLQQSCKGGVGIAVLLAGLDVLSQPLSIILTDSAEHLRYLNAEYVIPWRSGRRRLFGMDVSDNLVVTIASHVLSDAALVLDGLSLCLTGILLLAAEVRMLLDLLRSSCALI